MVEGEQVAHILLKKKVGKSVHFWEAKLLRHEITGDFKILRRWKTSAKVSQSPQKWQETDWEIENERKFRWKIIQKVKFSHFNIIDKYEPFENDPSQEMLQELIGE